VTPFESWAWLSNKRELQRHSQNKRVSKTSKNSRIKRELQRLQRLSNKKRVSKTSNKGSQIKESFKDFKGVCC